MFDVQYAADLPPLQYQFAVHAWILNVTPAQILKPSG